MADDSTRDRVRALVREVLAKAAPEEVPASTPTRFVNTVIETSTQAAVTRDESAKSVITEDDVRGLEPGAVLRIGEDARLTPLAADIVNERKFQFLRRASMRGSKASKIVAVGADHGGFKMKEDLKDVLSDLGHRVQDFGAYSEEAVDYPDFAHAVAQAVSTGKAWRGIMIDGAGIGSCIVANKVPGVRAGMAYDYSSAVNSREHNDTNVLTLGAGLIGVSLARQIVKTWLTTEFAGGRHTPRLDKIKSVEKKYLK